MLIFKKSSLVMIINLILIKTCKTGRGISLPIITSVPYEPEPFGIREKIGVYFLSIFGQKMKIEKKVFA